MIKPLSHSCAMSLVAMIVAVGCTPTNDAPVAAQSGSVVTFDQGARPARGEAVRATKAAQGVVADYCR